MKKEIKRMLEHQESADNLAIRDHYREKKPSGGGLGHFPPADHTIICKDCKTETEANSRTQIRCPICREINRKKKEKEYKDKYNKKRREERGNAKNS